MSSNLSLLTTLPPVSLPVRAMHIPPIGEVVPHPVHIRFGRHDTVAALVRLQQVRPVRYTVETPRDRSGK